MNIIDLFAGCGGLLDGFLQEGHYSELASVEWEEYPCETLRQRLKTRWLSEDVNSTVVRFDIRRTEELLKGYSDPVYGTHVGLDKLIGHKAVSVIIGGPPCQAYSLAGRIRDPNGMKDDYRNYLFESYISILTHFKPKTFVFENVVGLLSAMPNGVLIKDVIRLSFLDAGYEVVEEFRDAVFDVANYGVPQHRKRVIIMGVRRDLFPNHKDASSFVNTFYENLKQLKETPKTVMDAIGDLPKIFPMSDTVKANGRKFSHEPFETAIPNHIPRFHNQRDISVFRLLANDIQTGENKYIHTSKLKEIYTKVTGRKSNIHKYYVLRKEKPSNTIPAHLYKDGMRHIHPDPEQARSITVREAARLQSFSDDFLFTGPQMAQYKMIGNAVPPHFAKLIARALYCTCKKYMI